MGKALLDFGMQLAQGITGMGMGMLAGKAQDARTMRMNKEMHNLQMQGNREMMDIQAQKQYEMWLKTNYSAQMEQMKKAGLNPGLLYGMSGGGATTTGSIGAGSVGRGQAPTGGGEAMQGMGMALNLGLLRAQKENIEADTANKQADTANKPITGESIKAGTELTKLNSKIAEIEERIKGRSEEATVRTIDAAGEILMHQAEQERIKFHIADETWDEQIQKIQAELIGIGINNTLKEQQTKESKSRITNMALELLQKARALDQKDLEIEIRKFEANLKQEMPGIGQATGRIVNNMINEYLNITRGILGKKVPQKILK